MLHKPATLTPVRENLGAHASKYGNSVNRSRNTTTTVSLANNGRVLRESMPGSGGARLRAHFPTPGKQGLGTIWRNLGATSRVNDRKIVMRAGGDPQSQQTWSLTQNAQGQHTALETRPSATTATNHNLNSGLHWPSSLLLFSDYITAIKNR